MTDKQISTAELIKFIKDRSKPGCTCYECNRWYAIEDALRRLTEIDKHFELVMNPATGEYGCKAITT